MMLIILSILQLFLSGLDNRTLQSDCVVTIAEAAAQPTPFPGTFTMRGDRFMLSINDYEAAYDGKSLYVYSSATDELTISEPTAEELLEVNPMLYAKALLKVCDIDERPSKDGKQTIITLTPRDKSKGINRFVLRLKPTDKKDEYLPVSIEMQEGKKTSTLRLTAPKYISTTPTFRLVRPNAFINDLR